VSGSAEQRGVFLPGGPPASSPFFLGAVLLFSLLFIFPARFLPVRCLVLSTLLFPSCSLCSGTSCVRQSSLASSALFFRSFLYWYSLASTRYPVPSGTDFSSLLSVGGVPVSSGSGNPSVTNHGGCFAPSANRRKGDAGPIFPRVRQRALVALVGALRSGHSLPGRQVASSNFPLPPYANAVHGGGGQM
jgi:hypothetical protein